MPRQINKERCIGCGKCQRVCLVGCIFQENTRTRKIKEQECVDCGACELICPKSCITSAT